MNFAELDSNRMSIVALVLHANIIVQVVMVGLLIASIWSWAVMFGLWVRLGRTRRETRRFESDFAATDDVDALYRIRGDGDTAAARVFAAGVTEWRRSTGAGRAVDREGTRERLATVLGAAVALEVDRLADRLNFLATLGAVSPFVGLFGTVVGIMNSFFGIAQEQSSSLAVVAPGIAEALLATAIGLFVAIPAVVAYNRFSHGVNRIEARLHRFGDGFYAMLSRRLEGAA